MVARVLRPVLFAGLALALWTLARPASAAVSAPFCDDRGATALASPPALDGLDGAIRRAPARPCTVDELLGGATSVGRDVVGPAHRQIAPPAWDEVQALPVSLVTLRAFAVTVVDPPRLVILHPPYGVRARVERPPRV